MDTLELYGPFSLSCSSENILCALNKHIDDELQKSIM